MIQNQLKKILPKVKQNESMSFHTTFKVGGPAQYFYSALTIKDLIKAIKTARTLNIPFKVIGNGSNILVSDKGIQGLIIKNLTQTIKTVKPPRFTNPSKSIKPRFKSTNPDIEALSKLTYQEKNLKPVFVQLDSGVTLPKAIFSLIGQGITGLEWFAGIPSTIGGASFINLHGGHKYFSDYLVQAKVLTKEGKLKTVPANYFNYDYDNSSLRDNQDTVLTVTLKLFKGPKDKALEIAKVWANKKSHQPQRSAGCIFKNLSSAQVKLHNLPTPSTGYLIDKVLRLKGKQIGQARIAAKHAGFIENLGSAKASDIMSLINLIKTKAKSELNLNLELEIIPLGF